MPDDLDRAFEHHKKGKVAVSFLEEDLSGTDLAGMTSRGKRGEVLGIESRKCDLVISMVFCAGHFESYLEAISPWQVLS
jgi:hypothetical protein